MNTRRLLIIIAVVAGVAGCQLLGQTGVYFLRVNQSKPEALEKTSISPPGNQFEEGSKITLSAEINENNKYDYDNFRFYRWEGDINTPENPHTFSIKRDTDVTAVFGWYEYSLTVRVDGQGSVRESIVGARPNTKGGAAEHDPDKDYKRGTEVRLEATAEEGWKFCHWRGDNFRFCRGENPTIEGNHVPMWWDGMVVTAVFKPELEPCGGCTTVPNPD